MDPIELARSLPPRQRRALYAAAAGRLILPRMPWPAWLALCGCAALGAMAASWAALAPSLPALLAEPACAALALIAPALAIDGLLRKIPGARRSRLGYLALPLAACAALAIGLHFGAQPLARAQSQAAGAAKAQRSAEALLATAQAQFDLAADGAQRRAVADGLRAGLARARKPSEAPAAKAAALPPIPLPAGAQPEKAANAAAADAQEAEAFDYAARHAIAALDAGAALQAAGLAESGRQASALARSLRSLEPAGAADAGSLAARWLGWAAAASWIGSPIGALMLGYGLLASLLWPFKAMGRLLRALAALAWAPARRGVATLLAPDADALADLHRRARAYQSVQEELAMDEAPRRIESGPEAGLELSDLAVRLDLSEAALHRAPEAEPSERGQAAA